MTTLDEVEALAARAAAEPENTDAALALVQVAGEIYGRARAALDDARFARDATIRKARALGIPLRAIAKAAGVSNPLIQQITAKPAKEAPDDA